MGIGIVLLFRAVPGGLLSATGASLWHLFRRPLPSGLIRGTLLATLVGGVLTPAGLLLGSGAFYSLKSAFPRLLFGSAVHFVPTQDIEDLQGEEDGLADSASKVLRFKAKGDTVERILSFNLVEVDKKTFSDGARAPGKPFQDERIFRSCVHCFESQDFDHTFGSSTAYLLYDSETKDVFLSWTSID